MSKRCEVCAQDFLDEYAFHGHLLGKKHSKNVEFKKQNLQKEQNSVFISPVPPGLDPQLVFGFFSNFGPIQHYIFNPRYLIIEYKEKSPVEYLLNNPIYLNKWKLRIRRRKMENYAEKFQHRRTKQSPQMQKNENPETQQELRISLESERSLEEQVNKFLLSVQIDEEEMQQLVAMVCSSLDSAMKQLFPRCRAIPFGSSVTGLSLTGSDLDVFLDIREPIIEDDDSTLGCPSGWTPKTIFKGVKRVFYKNRPVFTQIVPIPMAKIPVIKFHHTASDMDCDISFKDGLGVHNSQLIKYLLTLDSRIKPLVVILKYWARNLDISGSGKINNYSLVMLIVFYLQQASVNLLPSIKELQKVHQRVYIREWQVNFNTDYPSTSENNSSSLLELLQGFFKFYSDFDFSTRIIRPLEGSSVLRKEFKKEMEACHRSRYVESLHLDRHACLQDPIQLDYNITSGWATKEIQGLKLSCLLALEVFESMRETPLGIIPRLLEPEMNVKLKASIKAKTKKKMNPTVSFTILAGKFKTFGLPEDFEENNVEDSQKFIEKNWFCTVYRLLEVILEKIFMLQIQVIYDKVGVKQMKLQEEDDVHTNNEDNILLNCSGKYPLHKRRKGKGQIVQPNVSPIQREIITSEKIVKEIDSKTADTPIKFQCLVVKKSNPLHALVELTDQELTNNCFMELAVYMQCKVHSWIEKEFMHMVQFKKNVWTSNES